MAARSFLGDESSDLLAIRRDGGAVFE